MILVSSVVGLIGFPGDTAYASAKSAMIGFARSLAKESARDGIRVNVVAPGFVETDMTANVPEVARQRIERDTALRRFGTAEEIGRAAVFLGRRHVLHRNSATRGWRLVVVMQLSNGYRKERLPLSEAPDAISYHELRDRIFSAIWNQLDPMEKEIEDKECIPHDVVWPILRDCGALGLLVPAEYGGYGLTIRQYLPIIAEFAKIHGGIRALVHVHNSFAHALAEVGSLEQKKMILRDVAIGEKSVAFALTEPDHGTGADLGTTARRSGDHYIVNGTKWLITNSDFASHFIVMVKTAPNQVSALLVERDTTGFHIERLPETMGCKGGEHGRLTFTDMRVSASALIGEEDQGQQHLEQALEISRVLVAASSLGTAERALELSVRRARERITFGKPIAARQAVQRYIAEMAMDVYALRGMLADAAAKWDAGRRIPAEASMCKEFGLEAVGRVTDRALLVHGGIGYTRQFPIERLYRDARLNWLEEGSPTIQYMVASNEILNGYQFDDAFGGPRDA